MVVGSNPIDRPRQIGERSSVGRGSTCGSEQSNYHCAQRIWLWSSLPTVVPQERDEDVRVVGLPAGRQVRIPSIAPSFAQRRSMSIIDKIIFLSRLDMVCCIMLL